MSLGEQPVNTSDSRIKPQTRLRAWTPDWNPVLPLRTCVTLTHYLTSLHLSSRTGEMRRMRVPTFVGVWGGGYEFVEQSLSQSTLSV